jgi:phage baseplate assembly protein gpV
MGIAIESGISIEEGISIVVDYGTPTNTVAPVISVATPNVRVGKTLTSTTGTWTGSFPILGYNYQWYADSILISGATANTYVIQSGDLNSFVTLPIDGGAVTVNAGDVLLVMVGHNGGAEVPGFGLAQATEEQTVLLYSDGGTISYLATPNAVMVRLSDQTLAVEENTADFSVNVFPNPSVNEATVSFELTNTSDVTLTVTDLAGKTVYTNNLGNTTAGKHNVEINTAVLAGGIYTVNFSANNTIVTKKLVVKK